VYFTSISKTFATTSSSRIW